jgi:hypothetical protein
MKYSSAILKPHYIVICTTIISFIAWILPFSDLRTGYKIKEEFTIISFLVLFFWYALIIFFSFLGYNIGLKVKRVGKIDNISDKQFFNLISILALIGVIVSYIGIGVSPSTMYNWVVNGQANNLKYMLYEQYSVGLYSLRYLAIISSALTFYRCYVTRSIKIMDFINVLSLLLVTVISSRLSLVIAIVIFGCLLIKNNIILRKRALISGSIVIFLLLTLLNYSRNSNYYQAVQGISNPILMNIAEIVTYLGAPFQASIGAANNIVTISNFTSVNFTTLLYFLLPSYIRSIFNIDVVKDDLYRNYVDIEQSLTTNSSFVELLDSVGLHAFLIIIVVAFTSSIMIGHFSKYKSNLSLISFILLYCFAEIWRTFLFNEGIIHMLIINIVLVFIIITVLRTLLIRRS